MALIKTNILPYLLRIAKECVHYPLLFFSSFFPSPLEKNCNFLALQRCWHLSCHIILWWGLMWRGGQSLSIKAFGEWIWQDITILIYWTLLRGLDKTRLVVWMQLSNQAIAIKKPSSTYPSIHLLDPWSHMVMIRRTG